MKKLLIVLMLMAAQLVNAQCAANAGGNKHKCLGLYTNTLVIGGVPTASGGTAPYTYCWSMQTMSLYPGSNISFTASDFLNDTTAANPVMNGFINDSTTFYLKVTDAIGCVSYDTCTISYTRFMYDTPEISLYIDQYFISSGDSMYLKEALNISGSPFKPYTYSWQPAYGLSTTTRDTGFSAFPTVATNYSVTVTDSRGCQSERSLMYKVFVCPPDYTVSYILDEPRCRPVGISENNANKIKISLYPNPAQNKLVVELPQSNKYSMKLSNALGTVCKEVALAEEKTELDLLHIKTGVYVLQVFEKGNLVATKKIIKE